MQDTEFTVEEGQLYMLQTRNAKRPAQAAVRFARDAVDEGLLDRDQALMTVDAEMLTALLVETFDPKADYEVIAKGVPAAPGGAKGEVVFTRPEAVEAAAEDAPRRSCSSARTPTPTTSPASTPPRASSRASAARPATPRSSPAAWASRASPPPPS